MHARARACVCVCVGGGGRLCVSIRVFGGLLPVGFTCIPFHPPLFSCKFCATGQQGFTRQLTDGEIFEQALLFSRDLVKEKGERLSNVVFMGQSLTHSLSVWD